MTKDLKIAFIQTALHWENVDANLKMFTQKIEGITSPIDLVVLPEMFTTGFSMKSAELAEKMNGKAMQWLAGTASKINAVVTGSVIIEEEGNYYNRLIWMRPEGTYETYDKRHLFRFANEDEHFSAGVKRKIIELKGWRICPLICFDLRFPAWSRNMDWISGNNAKEPVYDCLIYIANWPEARNSAWKTLLQARAHENQCYVIGVNRVGEDGKNIVYSGDSAVINAKGETLSTTNPHEENIEIITLSYKSLTDFREKFPVSLDADSLKIES